MDSEKSGKDFKIISTFKDWKKCPRGLKDFFMLSKKGICGKCASGAIVKSQSDLLNRDDYTEEVTEIVE